MTIAARIIGTYSRVSRGSSVLPGGQLPEVVDAAARLIARCIRPGPPLYEASARCQSPSNIFESVRRYFAAATVAFSGSERSSMYQSRRRPFSRRRAGHELPDALGLGTRQRVRLERALDERHVGEIERQPFGAEDALNHRQVLAAARHAFLDEVVKTALKQLDVRQHPLVERDGDVVDDGLEIRLDRLGQLGRGGRRPERRRLGQQLIDRRRLVLLFREAVALGQRLHFVGADAVDQTIEMLADARLGPRAVGRFEQNVDGAVELHLRRVEMPLLELALARPGSDRSMSR